MLIVQKYGGSSLARPEQIREAAARVAQLHEAGDQVIVVVSAMGKTTDQLVELAYAVSDTPNRRELDMLLTTGERISMSLMSMALNKKNCPAISFTGSQAGVFTDEQHSNARIVDIKPIRVEAALDRKQVVVLAGFQGVSPQSKEITTLGRGGSDTTAVAMAAKFKAERCEIRKDVDGVYSADPNVVKTAEHLPHLTYAALLDMTYWGAKVLHYRSVELASLLDIPVVIALATDDQRCTQIGAKGAPVFEQARILSVNSHKDVRWITVYKPALAEAMRELNTTLTHKNLPLPQLLDSETNTGKVRLLITAPTETLDAIARLQEKTFAIEHGELSSVTATCQGAFASPLPSEIATALEHHSVHPQKMLFSAMSVTVVIDAKDRDKTVQAIHDLRT